MKRANVIFLVISLGVLLAGAAGGLLWVWNNPKAPAGWLAQAFPWPVACTTRGCLTTRTWAAQLAAGERFAATTKQAAAPTREEALTSAVRRHLLEHAFLRTPVTGADVRRYREEILHLKDEAQLKEAVGMGFDEYDESVVRPFLQQAALAQERKTENLDELYHSLSQERFVLILPFHYKWDKNLGRVVSR